MKVSKKINSLRRQVMNSLTKNIGNSYPAAHLNSGVVPEINRILISRPNHRLGNQLLTTPLVQEVIDTFPSCKIDLFVKGGVANAVFENYENIVQHQKVQSFSLSVLNKFLHSKGVP